MGISLRKNNVDRLIERMNMTDDKKEYTSLEEFENHLDKIMDELLKNMSEDRRAYYKAKDS